MYFEVRIRPSGSVGLERRPVTAEVESSNLFWVVYNQKLYGMIVFNMDGFPSGQRGQTVNLLATPSKVRILLHPLAECRCGSIGRAADL